MLVVDFHFHPTKDLMPAVYDWVQGFLKEEDAPSHIARVLSREGIIRFLDENGVDYAVVLAEFNQRCTGLLTNEELAEFSRGLDRLIPFANINPCLTSRPAQELERCVREYGFRGVKLYPVYQLFYPNDPMVYPIYEKSQELGIPVMVHTGSSIFEGVRLKYGDPLFLDDVAVDFPHLTLIQVHSGRGFWYQSAFFLTRIHQNVYMEIAGLPPRKLLAYFPELEKNADKVLFGSDWPGPIAKDNIAAIKALPIKESTKAKILGENAARILGIEA